MTAVTISVTAQDISHGTKSNCRDCPVARAIGRRLPVFFDVIDVISDKVIISGSMVEPDLPDTTVMGLPEEAVRFISRFDNGDRVRPFSFELDVPGKLLAVAR